MVDSIIVKGAKEHNLKNVTVSIPRNRLVVLTGLSGSGKSTLAMDILNREGMRQYMDSLGIVADFYSKPKVDSIIGLSPAISVDQHITNWSPRSTVGTFTEVFTYLRLVFARIGRRKCPICGSDVAASYDLSTDDMADDETPDESSVACPKCRHQLPSMIMAHFSFNKPSGACPKCTGLGTVHQINMSQLINEDLSLLDGGVLKWEKFHKSWYSNILKAAAAHYGIELDPIKPIKELSPAAKDLLLYGVDSLQVTQRFPGVKPPSNSMEGRFEGVVTSTLRLFDEHASEQGYRERMAHMMIVDTCPECNGDRINAESRKVTVAGKNIIELQKIPFTRFVEWIDGVRGSVSEEEWMIAEPAVVEMRERVKRLIEAGAGYLSMDRATPTISAGEAQRLRLASLLGSGLTGVLYVLDEPTIGLHQRDTGRLVKVLRQLRDLGNTVLVIEHDLDVIRAADHVIDFGPGAGKNGGNIVAAGTPDEVASVHSSATGNFLSGRLSTPIPAVRREGNGGFLTIVGAKENNLKNLTVKIPLGCLVALAGVSGSGKSSLMFNILDRAGRQKYRGAMDRPGAYDRIEGWEHLDDIITIDQVAISRMPRSNAATYTDAFTPIRETFASMPEAKNRKLKASMFSFNVAGGRCERCQGAGVIDVTMHFMPGVQVKCPVCKGRRFKPDILEVKYNGYNVADILEMTIEEAYAVFKDVPAVASRLSLMVEVGMGYLQLGQPATTLSGGEAQRIKLAKELGKRSTGRTLYLLDEPTTGLHPADISRLLLVLQRLVDAGNTVAVIEHNLEVIKAADYVIDMGPEGGEEGGQVIAKGTPGQIAANKDSITGRYLKEALKKKE